MKKSRTFRKSFVAAIAALCLAAPLAVMPMTVSAETQKYDIKITATDKAEHTYVAYQVFSGTYSDDVLGNIAWSTSVNTSQAGFVEGIKGIFTTLKDADNITATMVAEALGSPSTTEDVVRKFADFIAGYVSGGTTIGSGTANNGIYTYTAEVEAGYYLIKDETSNLTGEASYSAYILEVVKDITVNAKASTPTIVKKVKEDTKVSGNSGYTPTDGKSDNNNEYEDYNDVADYDIGDTVPILDRGTLPTDLDRYDEYFYEIVDITNNGMTPIFKDNDNNGFVDEDITVKIDGKDVTKQAVIKAVTTTEGVTTITVTFEDITAIDKSDTGENIIVSSNSVVTVEYNATLDVDADIGLDGQESSVKLNFSNDPNETYVDDDDDKEEPTHKGTTPVDKIIVFTYELDITKLLRVAEYTSGDETFNTKPAGADQVKFKIKKDGLYANVEEATDGSYVVKGWSSNGSDIATQEDGTIKIKGLDDGTYVLEESYTPAGYNTMEALTITISATTKNGQSWDGTANTALAEVALTKMVGNGTEDLDNPADNAEDKNTDGVVKMQILNEKGSSLPSTGGIGTTIFYLGGGTMAAVAGVYLITKKRMKNEEDDEI